MYRSIYFKIILILVIFIITVVAVIGTGLIVGVSNYFTSDFDNQMEDGFSGSSALKADLTESLLFEDYAERQQKILSVYSSSLGIGAYRNYYVLDMNGTVLASSDLESVGTSPQKSGRLLAAMNRNVASARKSYASDFMDYAVYISNGEKECIIYVKDLKQEFANISWILFTTILESLLLGLAIAIALSFFLAKTITAPIQNLTYDAKKIAEGEFSHEIAVHSDDEIGILTDTFNKMKNILKSTLEEVSGERQKLQTVFSYLRDSVVAFDDEGRVLNINDTAERFFAEPLECDDVANVLTLDKLLSLLDIKFTPSKLAKSEDFSYSVEDVIFKDKVLAINFGELKYKKNEDTAKGTIVVIHDITGRYELEKARREFVADVSHELRTPLTSIKGMTETVLSDPEMPAEVREGFLKIAIDECDRMTRIVGDLLMLSKLDSNKNQWQISEFSPSEMLSHLCRAMRVDAEKHGHTLSLDIMPDMPNITADRGKIEQVIVNVISNSIKYTPDGGKIDVSAEANKMRVSISVKDNGTGIPKEDKDKIFDRFYRVKKDRNRDTGGTGLGLAIAKEIVEAHHGSIKIDSDVGVGTEITISLPIKCKLKL
ncbi:MAG: HAMP domain-containing protein [Clostridia bacterium]|nr:HAMP domain-containing protein [Clostridia bacterium]